MVECGHTVVAHRRELLYKMGVCSSMGLISKMKSILRGSTSTESYESEIVEAVEEGDSASIRALLREHPRLSSYADKNGKSLLHMTDQVGIAETLIVMGAAVNLQDKDGLTPLHYAAREGNEALVQQLIIGGADKSLTTNTHATAGDLAKQHHHDHVARLLPRSFDNTMSPSESGVEISRS